jgi:hypothetical protein
MDQKQDETNQKLDETTISINHLQSMCMNTHKALVGKFGVSLPIDGNLSQFTRVRCNKLHTHQLIC